MSPRKTTGATPEETRAIRRAEVARWERDNGVVPGTASWRGDGPTGGITWQGRARMAAARALSGQPLDDHDREALRRHPQAGVLVDGVRVEFGDLAATEVIATDADEFGEDPADLVLQGPRRARAALGGHLPPGPPPPAAPTGQVGLPPVDRNVTRVGHRHPGTAHAAAARALPRTGTLRRTIVDLIRHHGPLADDELEVLMGRSHQSVSASRNSLMGDGWLYDAGDRTIIRSGNEAIRWALTPAAIEGYR